MTSEPRKIVPSVNGDLANHAGFPPDPNHSSLPKSGKAANGIDTTAPGLHEMVTENQEQEGFAEGGEFYEDGEVEEQEEEGFFEGLFNELGPLKSAAVVAVILACFVVVWPKIILPLIMLLMGIKHEPPQQHQSADEIAQAFLGRGAGGGGGNPMLQDMMGGRFGGGGGMPPMGGGGGGGPMPGMMHPGFGAPHPGVRMAQQMGATPAQTTGGRKGFTSFLLPFYSVGVIVFLLYMLGKIFFKNTTPPAAAPTYAANRSYRERPQQETLRNSRDQPGYRYNPESEKFEVEQPGRLEEELVPGQPFSRSQLSSLQRRLTDTETALHRILQQLSTVPDGGQLDPESLAVVRHFTEFRNHQPSPTAGSQQEYTTTSRHNQSDSWDSNNRTKEDQNQDEQQQDRESSDSDFEGEEEEEQCIDQDQSDGENNASIDNSSKGPQGYLADLEKALMDFERFTTDYVTKHHQQQQQQEEMMTASGYGRRPGEDASDASVARGADASVARGADASNACGADASDARGADASVARGADASVARGADASPAPGADASVARGAGTSAARGADASVARGADASPAPGADASVARGAGTSAARGADASVARGASDASVARGADASVARGADASPPRDAGMTSSLSDTAVATSTTAVGEESGELRQRVVERSKSFEVEGTEV